MGIETAIGAGIGLIGAQRQASATRAAADRSANAQLEAARIQAEAQRFRPVGVTTAFGQTQYEMGPDGYLTQAGYNLTPELLAQQQQLMGALPGQLSQALQTDQFYGDLAGQFQGLGQQALGQVNLDPTQAAQQRTAQLQALLAPGRAEAQEGLFSNLAAKGLTGLAVETGTGARVNPYMAALAAEQGQLDRQIAAESMDQARANIAQDIARATGLFGTAQSAEQFQAGRLAQQLSPYQALLGQAQTLEGLGAGALDLGSALGARERTAASQAAQATGQGMINAASTQARAANAAAQQQAAMFGGLGSLIGQSDFSALRGGNNSGFRFFNAPAPTSAAGQYANNFQFSLPAAQSTQTAFAVPNYAPPSFSPTSVGAPAPRMFGAGANQPLFISP